MGTERNRARSCVGGSEYVRANIREQRIRRVYRVFSIKKKKQLIIFSTTLKGLAMNIRTLELSIEKKKQK